MKAAIAWRSKKQTIAALLNTKAKYVATTLEVKGVQIKYVAEDLQFLDVANLAPFLQHPLVY